MSARTLVVGGDGARPLAVRVAALAAGNGWPVVAEASAGLGGAALTHGPLLFGDVPAPDAVVVVGRPTLHRSVQQLLGDCAEVTVVAQSPRWPDAGPAARVVGTDWLATAAEPADPDWLAAWIGAASTRARHVSSVVERSWPSGLAVARVTMAALPSGAAIQLGSSNPVRDVDLAAAPRGDVQVVANRGLAGIDGTISSAIGLALGNADAPTYALVGDLTFQHDLTGLLIGPAEPAPDLTVVVVNDGGGGIFSTLEHGSAAHAGPFERIFGTPTGADIGALCVGAGVAHQLAGTAAELGAAVERRPAGLRVIEVRCSRAGLRDVHAALRAG